MDVYYSMLLTKVNRVQFYVPSIIKIFHLLRDAIQFLTKCKSTYAYTPCFIKKIVIILSFHAINSFIYKTNSYNQVKHFFFQFNMNLSTVSCRNENDKKKVKQVRGLVCMKWNDEPFVDTRTNIRQWLVNVSHG